MIRSVAGLLFISALIVVLLGCLISWQSASLLGRVAGQSLKADLESKSDRLAAEFGKIGRGEEDNLLFVARLLPLRQYVTASSIRQQAVARRIDPAALAKLQAREDQARSKLAEALISFAADHPYYVSLAYLGRDGRELVRIDGGKAVAPSAGVSGLAGPIPKAGQVAGFLKPDKNTWVLLTPVEANKKNFGSLAAAVGLHQLLSFLAKSDLPPRSQVWLADKNGDLLGWTADSKDPAERLEGLAYLKPYGSEILIGETDTVQVTIGREKYWLNYGPLDRALNWHLLVLVPAKAGLERFWSFRLSLWTCLVLAVLLLAGLWLSWLRSSYQRPLEQLNRLVKNLAEGQAGAAQPAAQGAAPLPELGRSLADLVKHYQQGNLDLQIKLATLQKKTGQAENRSRQLNELLARLWQLEPAGGLKKTAEEVADRLLATGLITAVGLEVSETGGRQPIVKIVRHQPDLTVPAANIVWPVTRPIELEPRTGAQLSLYSEVIDLKEPEVEAFLPGLGQVVARLLRSALAPAPAAPPADSSQRRLLSEMVLPPSVLEKENFALSGWLPAAGDGRFYNYTYFQNEGYLDIAVGQVPGQGGQALVNISLLKGLLRARAATSTSPEEICQDVNNLICQEQPTLVPTGLFYGIVSLGGGILSWTGAGAQTLAHRSGTASRTTFLKSKNLALGAQWAEKYQAREEKFSAGDTFVFLAEPLETAQQAELKKILVAAELPAAQLAAVIAERFPGSAGIVLKINGPDQTTAA